MSAIKTIKLLGLAVIASIGLGACASTPVATTQSGQPIYDPLESVNRVTMAGNKAFDKVLLDPATKAYRAVIPSPARTGVHNFLGNLKSPVYFANEVLQGDFTDAGTVLLRFLINSFVGFGGLMDTASFGGITHAPEDFGQTLASWGVGSGPYIVWPLLGPSTLRDTTGLVVDSVIDPFTLILKDSEQTALMGIRTGLTVLDTKDQIMDIMNDLYANSLDPYAALRSVYFQRRESLINDLDPNAASSAPGAAFDGFDTIE